MRILHTSDWHLGRTFHGANISEHLRTVLQEIAHIVAEENVDLVIVAGDIFDHAAPAAELYTLLDDSIRAIRGAGACLVMTSGNHDNASRLGAKAEWAAFGGVHFVTRPSAFREPIVLRDDHGDVDVYAIPYLEPMLAGSLFDGPRPKTQHAILSRVMDEINESIATRGNRSIVVAHCFAAKFTESANAEEVDTLNQDLQRDITAGGVDVVPASLFANADYAALGHIHRRAILAENVRYSGAPIHLTFGEATQPRGVWIVDLDGAGLSHMEWVDVTVPRKLTRLVGTLEDLLDSDEYTDAESDWVDAVLTDRIRPVDAMRRLQTRFPYCVHMSFAEIIAGKRSSHSYAKRSQGKSELEIINEFLEFVRDGVGANSKEQELLEHVLMRARQTESTEIAAGKKL